MIIPAIVFHFDRPMALKNTVNKQKMLNSPGYLFLFIIILIGLFALLIYILDITWWKSIFEKRSEGIDTAADIDNPPWFEKIRRKFLLQSMNLCILSILIVTISIINLNPIK